jgi:acetyltransferase-like isoleucine patch superfamily enzyme
MRENYYDCEKYIKIYHPYNLGNDVDIGAYTYIAKHSFISRTSIGKFCSIGPYFLCGWGIHPTNGISTSPMFYSTKKQNGMTLAIDDKIIERKKIIIGNDVFIGANVTVLDGITIGDGAIIGAGAVVSKDIPPYAIAVGCPIYVKRYRFDGETIKRLLTIKWWDFSEEKLKLVEKHFFSIKNFFKNCE